MNTLDKRTRTDGLRASIESKQQTIRELGRKVRTMQHELAEELCPYSLGDTLRYKGRRSTMIGSRATVEKILPGSVYQDYSLVLRRIRVCGTPYANTTGDVFVDDWELEGDTA